MLWDTIKAGFPHILVSLIVNIFSISLARKQMSLRAKLPCDGWKTGTLMESEPMTFQQLFVKWTALLCLWRWGALLSLPWARLWVTLPRGRTTRPPSTTTWPWCWLNSSMTAALWSERYRGCWMLELDRDFYCILFTEPKIFSSV